MQSTPNVVGSSIFYRGPLDVLVRTTRTEGVRGLYRGFGAVIVGGTPGTVLYLGTYEAAKSRLSSRDVNNGDFVVHFCSGMIAETIACIVYVPVDVIKERLQVQHSTILADTSGATKTTNYRNSWDALKQISKTEGLSGVYRGYGATLASFGPFSAFYFVFYEKLKEATRQHLQGRVDDNISPNNQNQSNGQEIPFQWTVLSSASAGALAAWLTSPLDMAKLRLQIQRGQAARQVVDSAAGRASTSEQQQAAYTGVVDCLRRSFREGGVRGLFRGAGSRVLHFAPATTVTMTTYETCRSFIANRNWQLP
jgi:hypothetical protein